MEIQTAIVLVLVFFLIPAMSVPVSFGIIPTPLLTTIMLLTSGFGVFVSAQEIVNDIDNFTLPAVPFFVSAELLTGNGGIAKRLINLAMLSLDKIPGSPAMTDIVGNAMFGSISGSGIVAATAIGSVIFPLEEEQEYDKGFPAAVDITTAPVDQLVPPTASFIVYSVTSGGVSVTVLLMAGWVPGLSWATLCMAVACVCGTKHGYVTRRGKMSVAVIVKTIREITPSPFLTAIIIDGALSGCLTPTEASDVATVYAFLLSVFVYKSIRIKGIPKILVDMAVMITIVVLIIGTSSVLSFVLSFIGLPQATSSLLLEISDNWIVMLLVISIMLLIVGTFMDMAPALFIFMPILLPIVKSLGVDPIQFGVMIVMNLSIGTITPPMGNVLFVGYSVTRLQVEDVMRKLLPFFAAIVTTLMLITLVPGFSMWLPSVLGLLK